MTILLATGEHLPGSLPTHRGNRRSERRFQSSRDLRGSLVVSEHASPSGAFFSPNLIRNRAAKGNPFGRQRFRSTLKRATELSRQKVLLPGLRHQRPRNCPRSVESFTTTTAGPPSPSSINAQRGRRRQLVDKPLVRELLFNANGWASHEQLGWVFPMESSTAGLWLWKRGPRWLWTDKEIYPFLYKSSTGGWLYFMVFKKMPYYFSNIPPEGGYPEQK